MAKLKLFLDTNIIIDSLADRKPFLNSTIDIINPDELIHLTNKK